MKSVFEKFGLIEKIQSEGENSGKTAVSQVDVHIDEKSDRELPTVDTVAESLKAFKESVTKKENQKLLKSDEIYNDSNIKSEGLNSLFIVESFLKALPDYLPVDVKRQSVLNIISSSGMSIDNLTKDGSDRLRCLNDFSKTFSYEVKSNIREYEEEIKKLSEKIDMYNQKIDYIKKLEVEQDAVVDYETKRVNNILRFIASDQV
jgi:hypothetical protein